MDWSRVETDWQRFKHAAKRRWDRLGEQQLNAIGGRRHLLAARIRDAYGISDAESERQVAAWQEELT
ncbi:MAG TPA: general stress protein CsbD [Burkholderiales bacterium]|nr:general stress protein CsbD [Burkholderiales bacterium]